ncbi:cupin domain-containing protein [Pseudaeromonas sharmana]|uniref:Cupin domain-containing protein n=1 Tax=Pseudaeromonas sharmana TaxID=328412 RepID=A0ABV8CS15_9GAMM
MQDISNEAPLYDGQTFHQHSHPVYRRPLAEDAHMKLSKHMALVCYQPAHPNAEYTGAQGGTGRNECRWLACEQGTQREGISKGRLDALLDSKLDPHASIGWHTHADTEEYYYLLQGQLWVEWQGDAIPRQGLWMQEGDCHRLGPGLQHWAQAGESGARFIALSLKCSPEVE